MSDSASFVGKEHVPSNARRLGGKDKLSRPFACKKVIIPAAIAMPRLARQVAQCPRSRADHGGESRASEHPELHCSHWLPQLNSNMRCSIRFCPAFCQVDTFQGGELNLGSCSFFCPCLSSSGKTPSRRDSASFLSLPLLLWSSTPGEPTSREKMKEANQKKLPNKNKKQTKKSNQQENKKQTNKQQKQTPNTFRGSGCQPWRLAVRLAFGSGLEGLEGLDVTGLSAAMGSLQGRLWSKPLG